MDYDNGERHLKEIDHVSILESIDEVFDGATSLLTQNAVMYGSTITALLAGLPIVGDLDVSVSNQEYMKLCQMFANSVKWVQIEGKNVPESHPRGRSGGGYPSQSHPVLTANHGGGGGDKDRYGDSKHLPINKVVAFHTVNGARVQIMQSRSMTGDVLEDALEVVRKVDFAFCGMAVDKWGRVLETIPHAYSDCQNRFIRIIDYQPRLNANRLKQRILKYTNRGWYLTFSIDQAMKNLRQAKLAEAKRPKKKKFPMKSKFVSGFQTKKTTRKGIIIEVKENFRGMIGSSSPITDVIRHFAMNYGLKFQAGTNGNGKLNFWTAAGDKPLRIGDAKSLIAEADKYLRGKYKIDQEALHRWEKKDKMSKMYNGPVYNKAGYGGGTVGMVSQKKNPYEDID